MAASALALMALPAVTAVPALAGGGCGGSCYTQVRTPPRYETVTEQVMVRGPRTYAKVVPAEYDTVQQTVLVKPAHRYWSVTRDAWGRKVACWVERPAKYATVTRQVMVRAPEVIPVAEPAIYGTRSRQVLVDPGQRQWVPTGYGYGGGHGFGPRHGFGPDLGYGDPFE